MKIKIAILIFVVSFQCEFSFAQTAYYPEKDWVTKSAKELKLNQSILDSAIQFAIKHENKVDKDLRIAILKAYSSEPDYKIIGPTKLRGGPAGLIIKNGFIAAQWGDVNRVDMTFSATKSFLSTMAGLAIDNGLIKNVTDKVGAYVWDGTYDGVHNAQVTWQHLLQQNSDWSGTLFGLHDWADRPEKQGGIDDWKNRKLNTPGTVFEYNDVRVNLLAYSLLQVWRKPLPMVLKEKLLDPINASNSWRWYGYDNSFVNIDGLMMQSVSGGGHHGGGVFINTIDMARFGLLFLRQGKWKNEQLINANWIKAAHQASVPNKDYGYMWWMNTTKKWKEVSQNIYYAAGFGGNYIVIDEEHDLVIVTRWMDDNAMGDLVKLVIQSATN